MMAGTEPRSTSIEPIERCLGEVIHPVEGRGRGENAELFAAFGEQPIDEIGVEAVGREDGFGDALRRILIEIETGRSESEIHVGNDGGDVEPARDRPGDIVGDRRGADPAFGADHRDDAAERISAGNGIELGNRPDEIENPEWCDEIFADAARHQIAIENNVVDASRDDDLGPGIAEFRQGIEMLDERVAIHRRIRER